jgi:hypothetical protein
MTARSQADFLENVDDETWKNYKGKYYYELHFSNKGGLVMPIILKWTYADGTEEIERIHAYIWRKNEKSVVKTFFKHKEVVGITLDPFRETADIDESNHSWPKIPMPDKVELFKAKSQGRR